MSDEPPAEVLEPTLPPYVNPHGRPAPRDRLGRKQPVRLDEAMLLKGAAMLVGAEFVAARVRAVPERAVAESGMDDAGVYALVECPCGGRPIVRVEPAKCAGCERHYIGSGPNPNVYVIYGDMEPPERKGSSA